jgi:hypothetical protein
MSPKLRAEGLSLHRIMIGLTMEATRKRHGLDTERHYYLVNTNNTSSKPTLKTILKISTYRWYFS